MTRLRTFRSLLVATGLFTVTACDNKSETREAADRAAENVNEQVADLKEESRDLAEVAKDRTDEINAIDETRKPRADGTLETTLPERTANDGRDSIGEVSAYVGKKAGVAQERVADGAKDIAAEAKDVGTNARELEDANNEFKYQRTVRVGTLRAVHAVAASQPMLIHAISTSYPFVDKDRAEVSEKLAIFQMRLDEAGNAVQSLELVEATDWEARNDAATKALDRVEDARDEVWGAVDDADLIGDKTTMR